MPPLFLVSAISEAILGRRAAPCAARHLRTIVVAVSSAGAPSRVDTIAARLGTDSTVIYGIVAERHVIVTPS
jgi:hypothetical protein